ncbi:hypothetical protein [Viscerimonas tarda]
MDFQLYLAMLAMLIPVFTAGTCMILTAFARMNCLTRQEKTLKTILVLYLSMTFLTWFTIFCYYIFPCAFVVLNIPCLAGFILAPLFFYRVIRFLTRLEQAEQFSPWHYPVPALIGAAFLLWSLFVPFEAQVEIVASRKLVVAGEYEAYSRFFTTKPLLRMLFVFVYYGFIARLLVRYYRRTNDADIPVRKPARWMVYLIVLSLVSVFSSVISALLPRNEQEVEKDALFFTGQTHEKSPNRLRLKAFNIPAQRSALGKIANTILRPERGNISLCWAYSPTTDVRP